jgi:hypothetical protein
MEYGHAKLTVCETPNVLEIVDTFHTCHQGAERKKGSDEFHGRCLLNRTKGSVQSACDLGRKRDCGKKGLLFRNNKKMVPGESLSLVDVRVLRIVEQFLSESKKKYFHKHGT